MNYTRIGKEVLLNGAHFADALEPAAAQLICDALNERPFQQVAMALETKLDALVELILPEDPDADNRPLEDLACPSCNNYRLEPHGGGAECMACGEHFTLDLVRSANFKNGE